MFCDYDIFKDTLSFCKFRWQVSTPSALNNQSRKKKEAVLLMSIESLGDIIIIIMKDRGLLFIGHQGRFQNRQCPAVGRAGMT